MTKPSLSVEDRFIIDEIEIEKGRLAQQLLAIIDGDQHAFLIYGPPGHGKSYIVRAMLKDIPHAWHTSDMSAPVLAHTLSLRPDVIHVFEDMETMYRVKGCQGILRAACGGENTQDRKVQWSKRGPSNVPEFLFSGGIVIIGNDNPKNTSLMTLGAVMDRADPQEWILSRPEMCATIRDIAINGDCRYGCSPEERLMVAEFVISLIDDYPINIRTFTEKALPFYNRHKKDKNVEWQGITISKIKGSSKRTPAEIEKERLIHCAVDAHIMGNDKASKLKIWTELTGLKSASRLYDYIKMARDEKWIN